MTEIYQTIGVELAPDYDVYAIADAIYTWEDGHMVADLERDDFWLIVAEHDLTEDWHKMVELPEGVDESVATIVNAGYWMVSCTPGAAHTATETIFDWFRWCRKPSGDFLDYHDAFDMIGHMILRARVMTSEWRNAASPLLAEKDRLSAWYEACRLCEYKGADMGDSRTFCRALHIVESDPDWFFHAVVFK
jgi:hypothetical protein